MERLNSMLVYIGELLTVCNLIFKSVVCNFFISKKNCYWNQLINYLSLLVSNIIVKYNRWQQKNRPTAHNVTSFKCKKRRNVVQLHCKSFHWIYYSIFSSRAITTIILNKFYLYFEYFCLSIRIQLDRNIPIWFI